jgi:hypothetical protein
MAAGSIITLRFAFTAHAAAVSINVPIDKLADSIGKGVAWIFKRWDTQTIQARHESVATLSLQISNLAGREMALVRMLSIFIANPSAAVAASQFRKQGTIEELNRAAAAGQYMNWGGGDPQTFGTIEELNRLVVEIKTNFDAAARTLDSIDPTWAAHNPDLVASLGGFVYDSAIRYIPVWSSIPSQFRNTMLMSDPKKVERLVATLNEEVGQLRNLSDQIEKTLGRTSAPPPAAGSEEQSR